MSIVRIAIIASTIAAVAGSGFALYQKHQSKKVKAQAEAKATETPAAETQATDNLMAQAEAAINDGALDQAIEVEVVYTEIVKDLETAHDNVVDIGSGQRESMAQTDELIARLRASSDEDLRQQGENLATLDALLDHMRAERTTKVTSFADIGILFEAEAVNDEHPRQA